MLLLHFLFLENICNLHSWSFFFNHLMWNWLHLPFVTCSGSLEILHPNSDRVPVSVSEWLFKDPNIWIFCSLPLVLMCISSVTTSGKSLNFTQSQKSILLEFDLFLIIVANRATSGISINVSPKSRKESC